MVNIADLSVRQPRFLIPSRSIPQPGQNSLLRVEPVFGLVKNGPGIGLESGLINLLAPVGGQAVHDQCAGLGKACHRPVHLVALQLLQTLGRFSLLAIETQTSV